MYRDMLVKSRFFFFLRAVSREQIGNTIRQWHGGMPCFLNCTVVPSNGSWCHYIPFSLVLIDVEKAGSEKCRESHSLWLQVEEHMFSAGKQMATLLRSSRFSVCHLVSLQTMLMQMLRSALKNTEVKQHSISTNSVFAACHWAISHSPCSEQVTHQNIGVRRRSLWNATLVWKQPDWTSHSQWKKRNLALRLMQKLVQEHVF